MSGKGVSIRKMKEILRLYYDANLAMHQIARSLLRLSNIACLCTKILTKSLSVA